MSSRLTVRDFALAFALLAICAFFATKSPSFLAARNLSQLLTDLSITATLALGMLLIILPGHIDLSVGSGVGLIGGIAAVLASGGEVATTTIANAKLWLGSTLGAASTQWIPAPPWPAWQALLFALCVALILWSLMGALIIRERIPAFIITLGGLLLFKGLFWKVIQSHTIPIAPPSQATEVSMLHALHIGSFYQPIWETARHASGALELFLRVGDHRLPVLAGTGNLYLLLTTSCLSPMAGYAIATLVTVILALRAWLGWRSARAMAVEGETPEGEMRFLRFFLGAQLLFLLVIVANQDRGLPLPALLLGLVATWIWILTTHTPFGRYLYAIGGNEEAAIVSGVPVKRVVILAFTIMGGIVALTGFLQTAYGGYSTTTVGDLMELDAVAACVIGGVSLRGGRGTVLGVLFGALIMATLINGMTLLSFAPEHKFMARGIVLILAVWMDVRLNR